MLTSTFIGKAPNWQDGTIVCWFVLDGTDNGTGRDFDKELFGITSDDKSVVEADGDCVGDEYLADIVLRECKIPAEIIKVNYISKDQDWHNETTVYWFKIDGTDYGTEKTFEAETFGVADCNGNLTVIDIKGYPVENEYVANIVLRECKITDEMVEE